MLYLYTFLVFASYMATPVLLTVGWTAWATSPKRNDLLSCFSLTSFALTSGSAALVVAAIAYIIWVGGLPHYDPRLIRFIVWGLLVSLTALAASIPGLWRKSVLRWFAPSLSACMLLIWFNGLFLE